MTKIRKILSSYLFIHFMVFLGMFALLGWIFLDIKLLLLGMSISFAGAICGSFIRIIDIIKNKN